VSELVSISEFLPTSGVGIVFAIATWSFAKYLNGGLNDDMRSRLSQWFLSDAPKFAWPSHMLMFFDALFGQKAFSWRCVSSVAAIALTVGGMWWLWTWYDEWRVWTLLRDESADALAPYKLAAPDFPLALLSVLLYSFPMYYLAVLKTRFLLRAGSRYTRLVSVFLLLLADIISTGALVAAPYVLLLKMPDIVEDSIVDLNILYVVGLTSELVLVTRRGWQSIALRLLWRSL
jgi:hypothetical protein